MAITTTVALETYLGTHSYSAGQLAAAVAAACAAVENYCGRTFDATDWAEWHYLEGDSEIVLDQSPIVVMRTVLANPQTAMELSFSATGEFAQASVYSDGAMTIYSVTAGSAPDSADLVLTSYDTMAALETAIELNVGWSAEVIEETQPLFLKPGTTANCVGVEVALEAAKDPLEILDVDAGAAVLRLNPHTGWVCVYYQAGELPGDLTLTATEMAASYLTFNPGVVSERIGNYSYTRGTSWIDTSFGPRLDPYRRRTL